MKMLFNVSFNSFFGAFLSFWWISHTLETDNYGDLQFKTHIFHMMIATPM